MDSLHRTNIRAVVTLGLSTGQMLIIQKVNLTKKEGKELLKKS